MGEIKEYDDLIEPDIDALIEEGYTMEEIETMIYEYEIEKKVRKNELNQPDSGPLEDNEIVPDTIIPRIIKVEPILTPNEKELLLLDNNIKAIQTDINAVDKDIDKQRKELINLQKEKANKDKERKRLVKFINDSKGLADEADGIKKRKMMKRKRD